MATSTKPAPRRLVTYSKGGDRQGSNATPSRPAKPATDNPYDFPDSDDGAPKPAQRKKAVTPAKPAVRQKTKTETKEAAYDFPDSDDEPPRPPPRVKPATPFKTKTPPRPQPEPPRVKTSVKKTLPPKPSAQRSDDEARKRKHASAFDVDKTEKPPKRNIAVPSRSIVPPSKPVTKTPSSQSKITQFTTAQIKAPVKVSPKQTTTPAPAPPAEPVRSAMAKLTPRPRSPKSESKPAETATPRPGKKVRLIDRLASQKEESSGSDSDSDAEEEYDVSTSAGGTDRTPRLTSQAPSQTPMSQSSVRYGRDTWSRPGTLVNKKVKLTYSQARSIREDTQTQSQPQSLGAMMDSIQDSLVSSPSPGPGNEFDMTDDEEDLPKNGIKSLHELRRAGANSRFGDEMEDLMSRIGKPGPTVSSMRRNALIDLAQKLQRNDFAAQFRDHAGRDNIAKDIGKETEMISAFSLGAALTIFLSSQNAPHMLKQLVEEHVGKLLARLLRQPEDIDAMAKKRESNLSKMGRASVAKIKTHLMGMPIWHGCKLQELSPRTVALRLLHILQRNLDPQSQSDIVRHLETELSEAAEMHARVDSVDDVNFVLVALIMEAESGADTVALGQDQVKRQAATSAQLLRKALPKWPTDLGEIPAAILKLSINTTNTDLGAKAFSEGTILSELARCVVEGLRRVQEAVSKGALKDGLYDGLLLNMGVLINILEHCAASRSTMDDESVDKLAKLFIGIRPSVMDADTEEKSKVSVAVGYLAVVLGYLCLNERGRKAMEQGPQGSQAKAAMRDLTQAIQHFMELYRSVDTRVHELEGLVVDLRRYSR